MERACPSRTCEIVPQQGAKPSQLGPGENDEILFDVEVEVESLHMKIHCRGLPVCRLDHFMKVDEIYASVELDVAIVIIQTRLSDEDSINNHPRSNSPVRR